MNLLKWLMNFLQFQIRVSKKEHDSDVSRQIGGVDQWHHLTCFAQLRSELGFFESADKIPGFRGLSKEDQAQAKNTIQLVNGWYCRLFTYLQIFHQGHKARGHSRGQKD